MERRLLVAVSRSEKRPEEPVENDPGDGGSTLRRTREEFLSHGHTLPTEGRDYPEWHRGRKEYAAWVICVQNGAVQARLDAARAHMAEFLLEPYLRQAHVTLCVCGFLTPTRRSPDDYPLEAVQRSLRELEEAGPAPFDLEIGGLNSFAAAPFLEVRDPSGSLEEIRGVLSRESLDSRDGGYVPHVTVGLYSNRFDTRTVSERISFFDPLPPITHRVAEIGLATYAADEICGPLSMRRVFRLSQ